MKDATGAALVLGGGGLLGGAWTIGMLAGLAQEGVDLTGADLILGTSMGAVTGARLAAGQHLDRLYAAELAGGSPVDVTVTAGQTARYLWAALGSRDPERAIRRLGRAALAARTVPEAEVFAAVDTLLDGVRDWPRRDVRFAAVDALSGALRTFGVRSGVSLTEAVAVSCAVPLVWPAVTLDGRRWMDGGTRSTANVHLAHGYGRVVALAPVPKAVGPHPDARTQGAELAAAGSRVSVLTPDRAARRAIGRNLLDPRRRTAAARAGHAQGVTSAPAVAGVWHRQDA
ncbi:patatin-like phospholipase family protein [Streptomyces sp. NPDC048603]|uniref:patatin-like phospholipase family protein n=1 Tax=Streptomyces sp. NPDC048603 TaxID=3365577 RepID=UPI003711FE8F